MRGEIVLVADSPARAVLVLTGYGLGEWEYRRDTLPVTPDHVAEDLLGAVEWAIEGQRS